MNDNQYASFGLPGDAASPPSQANPPRPRGWFSRNLWWLLPTALLAVVVPCGCCGGIFVWLIGSLKSSDPYQMALKRVRTDPQVVKQLGEPIAEASWMPMGNFSYNINNGVASGMATFDFSVSGPKDTAHVHADLVCRKGKWSFRVLEVTPASSGKVLPLPVDEKPEKAEKEAALGT